MACRRQRRGPAEPQACCTTETHERPQQPERRRVRARATHAAKSASRLEALPYACWRLVSVMLDAASVVAASSTCHKLLTRGRSKAVWADKLRQLPPRVRDAFRSDGTQVESAKGGAGGPATADSRPDQAWTGLLGLGLHSAAACSPGLPAEPHELAQYRQWCTRRRFPRRLRSSPTTSKPEAVFKVVLLGPSRCGKTALCRSISKGCSPAGHEYPCTIGVDFMITSRTARGGLDCRIQVWDGSYSCRWMRHSLMHLRTFLRGAQLVVFCYDESDSASLRDAQSLADVVKKYYADLNETGVYHPASAEPAYMVLGTKSDLPKAVSSDDVDKLVHTLRSAATCRAATMRSCSAMTGDGVSEFVQAVADQCEANSFDDGSGVDAGLRRTTKPPDGSAWAPSCVIS